MSYIFGCSILESPNIRVFFNFFFLGGGCVLEYLHMGQRGILFVIHPIGVGLHPKPPRT